MDVAQNLIFIALYYIYLFNLMMLIESGILLKNHISCNLCQNITSKLHSDNLREL